MSYGTFLMPHSVLWMWVRSARGLYQRDEQGRRDRIPKPHRIYKSSLSMCWISSLPTQMLDSLVAARHSCSPSRERGEAEEWGGILNARELEGVDSRESGMMNDKVETKRKSRLMTAKTEAGTWARRQGGNKRAHNKKRVNVEPFH